MHFRIYKNWFSMIPPLLHNARLAVLLFLFFLSSGCSQLGMETVDEGRLYPGSTSGSSIDDGTAERPQVSYQPWEMWQSGKDLNGGTVRNIGLLRGDEFLEKGDRIQALREYEFASNTPLTVAEKEALNLRIAAMQLSNMQPKKALSTVSEFFRNTGLGAQNVPAPFAVVMAYSYAQIENVDQSLAWFSRSAEVSRRRGVANTSSVQGARSLLRALTPSQFEKASLVWGSDPFLSQHIGVERARRTRGGKVEQLVFDTPQTVTGGAFRSSVEGETVRDAPTVVAFLPLSGRYQKLGESVKQGIELAVQAERGVGPVNFRAIDTGGSALRAQEEAQTLRADNASVVLGPLLSEPAQAVEGAVRARGIPLISFSKSSGFQTGGGIYQLGATSESQVRSLVAKSYAALGMSKFAIVYPQTAVGFEFASLFKQALMANQLEIVYESSYQPNDQAAFVQMAQELEAFEVHGLFIPDRISASAQIFSNLRPDFRRKVRPVGTALWDNRRELNNSLTVLDGAVFVSVFYEQSERPIVGKFVSTFQDNYGKRPNFLAAQGFDAATLALAAVRRHQRDMIGFERAFNAIDSYQGLTGDISVRGDGLLDRAFSVVELRHGKLVELENATSTAFVYRGNARKEMGEGQNVAQLESRRPLTDR